MRRKKILLMFSLITIFSVFQACVPATSSTITPQRISTKKPATKRVYTVTPQSTPTNSYHAVPLPPANLCNLRQGPGTDYPIVDYSEKGDVHEIYGVNGPQTWLLLDNEESIWIAASLISLDTDITNIPIVNNYSSFDETKQPETPTIQTVDNPTKSVEDPEPTKFAGCPNGCTYHAPGCDIKGNISINTGEKIYHVPGGEFYDKCNISPEYGERWFCTEQEAINNGWRKSQQ